MVWIYRVEGGSVNRKWIVQRLTMKRRELVVALVAVMVVAVVVVVEVVCVVVVVV